MRERARSINNTTDFLITPIMYAPLETSLVLRKGTGDPTWSRATKAWGFNELGYLAELASGCAFFGGARLVRNTVRTKSEDFSNAAWTKANGTTTPSANVVLSANATSQQSVNQIVSSTLIAAGQVYIYCVRAKYVAGGVEFIQLTANGTGFGSGQYCNFSLLNGTKSATGCTATASLVSGTSDTYDFSIKVQAVASGNYDAVSIILGNAESDTRFPSFIGDGIKSFELLRAWSVDVTNYDASYVPEYVSVGVEASPYFGAGIDGAKYFSTDYTGGHALTNLIGFRREAAATNNLLHSRDLSNAAWSTKTNITAAKTATGLDGIANTATTLTATAADAIILQPITLASAALCASAYIKRRTGTGTISFTQDGGSTWTDITAQINGSTWSRVQITSTLANPSVGFKISTSGDEIDVDCVQNEVGAVATSPIVTTTAAVTRNVESLTYQTASNIDFAVGTIYGEIQTPKGSNTRMLVQIGDGYAGITSAGVDSWRSMDGTTTITATGLSDITTAKRKRAVSWGGATQSSCGDGIAPTSGAFDGAFGSGATIAIGPFTNGYIGPVAIYNYQMTDAQLQEVTK